MGGAASTSPRRQASQASAGRIQEPDCSSPTWMEGWPGASGGHSRRKKRLSNRTGAKGGVTQRPA